MELLPLHAWTDSGHLYNSQRWLRIIENQYGFEILLVYSDGEYLFPLVRIDDQLGKRLIAIPFSDYCPVESTSRDNLNELVKRVRLDFAGYNFKAKFNKDFGQVSDCTAEKTAVYHMVDLSSPQDNFHKSFIRGKKKAVKENLLYTESRSTESLDEFYRLYSDLRLNKFESIPQPKSFFGEVFKSFIELGNGHISEVTDDGEVVASTIILYHGDTAYYKYGCSAISVLDKKPNNLLFHDLMHGLNDKGFKKLDLGSSGVADSYAGLRRWKSQMGGVEHGIYTVKTDSINSPVAQKTAAEFNDNLNEKVSSLVNGSATTEEIETLSAQIYRFFA